MTVLSIFMFEASALAHDSRLFHHIDHIRQLYSSATSFDESLLTKELERVQDIRLELKRELAADVISQIDVNDSFATYYCLGGLFCDLRHTRSFLDSPEAQEIYFQALYSRLTQDAKFRNAFAHYVTWAKILKTELADETALHEFVALLKRMTVDSIDQHKSSGREVVLALMYAHLFDIPLPSNLGSWENERASEFNRINTIRAMLWRSINEDHFLVRNGFEFQKTNAGKGTLRTVFPIKATDDARRWFERLPNSTIPVLPFNNCDQDLIHFLDLHASNRLFCIGH